MRATIDSDLLRGMVSDGLSLVHTDKTVDEPAMLITVKDDKIIVEMSRGGIYVRTFGPASDVKTGKVPLSSKVISNLSIPASTSIRLEGDEKILKIWTSRATYQLQALSTSDDLVSEVREGRRKDEDINLSLAVPAKMLANVIRTISFTPVLGKDMDLLLHISVDDGLVTLTGSATDNWLGVHYRTSGKLKDFLVMGKGKKSKVKGKKKQSLQGEGQVEPDPDVVSGELSLVLSKSMADAMVPLLVGQWVRIGVKKHVMRLISGNAVEVWHPLVVSEPHDVRKFLKAMQKKEKIGEITFVVSDMSGALTSSLSVVKTSIGSGVPVRLKIENKTLYLDVRGAGSRATSKISLKASTIREGTSWVLHNKYLQQILSMIGRGHVTMEVLKKFCIIKSSDRSGLEIVLPWYTAESVGGE